MDPLMNYTQYIINLGYDVSCDNDRDLSNEAETCSCVCDNMHRSKSSKVTWGTG